RQNRLKVEGLSSKDDLSFILSGASQLLILRDIQKRRMAADEILVPTISPHQERLSLQGSLSPQPEHLRERPISISRKAIPNIDDTVLTLLPMLHFNGFY